MQTAVAITAFALAAMIASPAPAQDAAGGPPGYQRGFLVLLTPGPQLGVMPQADMQRQFMRHGARLTMLLERGEAVVAGPFLEPATAASGALGFVVLRGGDEAAARRTMDGDPAVQSRLFGVTLIATWIPPGGPPR